MTDKVALITGAGSGIGRAAALALQAKGYHVTLAGRRVAELEKTASMAAPGGGDMLPVGTDVGDVDSIRACFKATADKFGRLDVLFNNAGMGTPPVDLEDLPVEAWKQVLDVNLTGSFVCAQEAIKIMKNQTPMGGRIINNGSISAYAPRPNSVAYTSTKHAISGLTRTISLDCRKYDIACSQLDIGNADTDMGGRMKHGVPQANGEIKAEAVFDVKYVADAVVFMSELPLDTNVQFMTIMATKMPFVGRG
ncbi:MAG: NAD(P)-dependent dehydrogenase (short-subunit alcohol dehydrogenase family) [Hyphomicrobiaceae bacterium]|jgi:NAD(P)-dependent dehydrogenase (short-subunit alcohol dehydrogenase family)